MEIKFSHAWNNKLSNSIFTTIRKYDFEKETYYQTSLGKTFDIILQNQKVREAKLLQVEVRYFKDIDEYLLMLDTGKFKWLEQAKIFSSFGIDVIHDKVIILTFGEGNG